MLISCLSEKGGLDSKGCVWSVELNTSKLGRLQINIEHTIVKAISYICISTLNIQTL